MVGTDRKHAAGPVRYAQTMLAALALWHAYIAFWGYRLGGLAGPGAWADLLTGHADAPFQYRMGAVLTAHWLSVALHLKLPLVLAAITAACTVITAWTLLHVLTRTTVYREADTSTQWLGAATLTLLVAWPLGWLQYQLAPETLPAAMCLALMLWLWTPSAAPRILWRVVALMSLTLALATLRADLACLVNAGIFLFLLADQRACLALPRRAALLTSALAAIAAAVFQLWLMRVIYPHATYGGVKLFQLWPNLHHASRWPPFILFLIPTAWLALQLRRHHFADAPSLAFATAAALYFLLWITLGKIDEVRIFVPFALVLAPLTAQAIMLRAATPAS
jgi:hypothetical protein